MFNPQRITGNAPSRYKYYIESFGGADTASQAEDITGGRAGYMHNFIRDKLGVITKRKGFRKSAHGDDSEGKQKICSADSYGGCEIRKISRDTGLDWIIKYSDTNISIAEIIGALYQTESGHIIGSDYTIKKEKSMNEIVRAVENEERKIRIFTEDFDFINGFTAGGKYYVFAKCKNTDQIVDRKPETQLVILEFDNRLTIEESTYTESHEMYVRGIIDPQRSSGELMKAEEAMIPIPTIVIGARPQGGGTTHSFPNMLTPLVTESFCVTEDDLENGVCKRFQLSMKNQTLINSGGEVLLGNKWMKGDNYWYLDGGYGKLTEAGADYLNNSLKIEVLTQVVQGTGEDKQYDYEWQTLTNIFKKDRGGFFNTEKGAIWIPSAKIGATPIRGEDNVRITYIRDMPSFNREDIWKIFYNKLQLNYGVGGYKDRLFTVCDGNRIYYSELDSPLMIGDLNYIQLGSDDTKIKVVSGVGQYLYAADHNGMIYIIAGSAIAEDNTNTFITDAKFIIADRVQGSPPVHHGKAECFGEEFVYLSEEGLTAIYHDNIYDTRHAQCRSRMLDGVWRDTEKEDSVMVKAGDFLYIGTGKGKNAKIFVLDEKQVSANKQFPYSGKQYEAYIFDFADEKFVTDPADSEKETSFVFGWQENGLPCFSDERSIYVYDTELEHDIDEYGENAPIPITAEWETPPISQYDFLKRKDTVRVSLAVGHIGDVFRLEYKLNDGDWQELADYSGRFMQFNYGKIDYRFFSYRTAIKKLFYIKDRRKMKRYIKITFRISNCLADSSLTLQKFGFEYTQEVV